MPVKQFKATPSADHTALTRELLDEWNNPSSAKAEPVILEEAGTDGKMEHVYVIWTKWGHLDRVERSEIIMDAAEKHLSRNDVLNITIAMGLTPQEAQRMGLKY